MTIALAALKVTIDADISDLKRGMDQAPKHASDAVSGIADKFKGLGDKLAPIAKAAGVAAGLAVVAGAAIGFEQEALSDKLAAQLGLSEADSKLAGGIAGELYADAYGESFGQVNEAIGAVVSTLTDGLGDPAVVEKLSGKVLDLASAFDVNVADAVSRAGALMESGLAKDADHAMDLIVASMQKIPKGLQDELGDATTEYARFFADLGFTGEETFGLLASATDAIQLDKIGDAVKEFTIRATDMSALTVGAFDTIGLDAETMAGRILAGGDEAKGAFDQIVDGLLAIEDPVEQSNTAIALFGAQLEDMSVSQIDEFLGSLGNMGDGLGDVEGAADRMSETLNNNAQVKITKFKRGIEDMLTKVVEAPGILGDAATAAAGLGSVVAPMAPMLSGVAVVFQDQLSGAMTGLGEKLKGLGGKFGGMMKAAGTASLGVVKSLGSMIAQSAVFVASQIKTAAVFVAKWALMGVQSLLHAAKVAAAWLIAMGPIALIVAAVVGLAALIITNWDNIVDFFKKLPARISSAVSGMWDGLKNAFKNAVNWIIDKWNGFRLQITLPSLLGGGTIGLDTPNIPRFHDGGVMPGAPGSEGLAILEAGEKVSPNDFGGAGMGSSIVIEGDVYGWDDFVKKVRDANVDIRRLGFA